MLVLNYDTGLLPVFIVLFVCHWPLSDIKDKSACLLCLSFVDSHTGEMSLSTSATELALCGAKSLGLFVDISQVNHA